MKVEDLFKIEVDAIEAEKKLRTIYQEAGFPEDDINHKIMEFRQKIYERAEELHQPASKPQARNPVSLEIKSSRGKEGRHYVNMTILAEDKMGVKGTIRVLDSEGGKEIIKTQENGTAYVRINITKDLEKIHFLVLGTPIEEHLIFVGPETPIFPHCPDPTPEDLQGGFWAPFKAGRDKAKKMKKEGKL